RKTIEDYLAQADLVVGIGYDPVEICYEEWMPPVPLVHVDEEPADVDGSVRLEHQAIGDLSDAIRRRAAMPAAANAWGAGELGRPNQTVAAVMGDGCFLMMAGEMATAARLRLPIPFVVLNDNWLALIKVKQERKHYAYSGVEVVAEPGPPPAEYFGVPVRVAR